MKTVFLPRKGAPFVSFRLAFEAGSSDDPPGKEGAAALTAGLLAEGGTKTHSYEELLKRLYPMAAGVGVQVERDTMVVHGTVHRDHLDRYYEMFLESVAAPRFEPREFERLKDDQRNAIVSGLRAVDDEGLGQESLATLLYTGHPYGRPVEGTVSGIASLTRDDVVAFHRRRLTGDRATLGLSGDLPEGFADRVVHDLRALPESETPVSQRPEGRTRKGFDLLVVTKPARASAISMGHTLSITRADDDFVPLFVASSYLGEHRTFNGRLMDMLRTRRGLTYGAYSYVEHFVQDGASTFALPNVARRRQAFTIWIRPVAAAHAHFSIRAVVRELRHLVRDGLTPEAFASTREFLLNYSKLWVQTPSRRLGFAMDGAFYGRPPLIDELEARLPAMTVDEVNGAIRRHLRPEDLAIAVVADPDEAAALADALAGDAPSPIEYETETLPEVLAEDREVAGEPVRIEREHCRIVPADAMFER